MASVWEPVRWGPGVSPPRALSELQPLTTGLLSHASLKVWSAGNNFLALRNRAVAYPVFPEAPHSDLTQGTRKILSSLAEHWCVMGPREWVDRLVPSLPSSTLTHQVDYEFLCRPAIAAECPPTKIDLRLAQPREENQLFSLQEAYEKEEVLFHPSEFHPQASRAAFSRALREQVVTAAWIGSNPVAKAGTNALTMQWAQLGGVYTKPEYRGQGVQKSLLGYLLNHLNAQGRAACLFVKKDNRAATELYFRLGFTALTEFTILYGRRSAWAPGFR